MNLGKQLKDARTNKGVTQQQLADILEVSVHTISKYEQGTREPSLEIMSRIAAALGVEMVELIADKDELIKLWGMQELSNEGNSKVKESQLVALLQDLYPNDFNFIVDLLGRLGFIDKGE